MTNIALTLIGAALTVTATSGCLLKAKAGTGSAPSTASKPAPSNKKECKSDLVPADDARMPCIIDGSGDTERVGEVLTFKCAPFDVAGHNTVYGDGPFHFMTQICPAAVYDGKLDPTTGGTVKIEILAKQNDFPQGEKKNGVKSIKTHSDKGYHAYRFVD